MALQPVLQEHYDGCLTAGIAILLGKSYMETFSLLRGRFPIAEETHGFEGFSMKRVALQTLSRAGIKGRPVRFRTFNACRKHNKPALLIIRWQWEPQRCHTIIYDHETKKFLDPYYGMEVVLEHRLRRLEEQVDCIISIENIPQPELSNDIFRCNFTNTGTVGEGNLRQATIHSDGQATVSPQI